MGLNIEDGQFGGETPTPYDQLLALILKTDGHTDITFAMKQTGLAYDVVMRAYERLVKNNVVREQTIGTGNTVYLRARN